jgi:phosphomannomutase
MDIHIDEVLTCLFDVEAVKAAKFKVVVDGVNSSGSSPKLLELMGVEVVNYTVNQHISQSRAFKEHLLIFQN